jgi:hypothetical protein
MRQNKRSFIATDCSQLKNAKGRQENRSEMTVGFQEGCKEWLDQRMVK